MINLSVLYRVISLSWLKTLGRKAAKREVPEDCKLAILVRTDLSMSKGKIATSCSHAAVASYIKAKEETPFTVQCWLSSGQKKIVLKWEKGEDELKKTLLKAKNKELTCVLIRDMGKTQVAPGSITAAAIGPASSKLIEEVIPGLKLL